MENNPFRKKPANIQQNIDDWGKSKFRPSKFGGVGKKSSEKFGSKKPFTSKFNNERKNEFNKNKKTCRYELGNHAAPVNNATPWKKFKDEILFRQSEEERAHLQPNMKSSEAKSVLKQREINYRKSLILEKNEEPITWENFDMEESNAQKHETNFNYNNNKNSHRSNKKPKNKNFNKKNSQNSKLKSEFKEFITQELLDNFDSKKLSYKQNDMLRSVITKTTIMASGGSLERVVSEMKKKAIKKQKFNKK